MNLKKISVVLAAISMAFIAGSCNKDDDDTSTSNSFSGTLYFDIPSYVRAGTTLTLVPYGVTADEDDVVIGYYWTASPVYTSKDTTKRVTDPDTVTGAYELVVKDTLCTMTVTCGAFATGYYTTTTSIYCTIVNPELGGTISGDGIDEDTPTFSDDRDGTEYYYKQIGDLDWFVRNMDYPESGRSFAGCEVMDGIYGRYYTWEEAQEACPEGWRLPSDEDWLALAKEAGYEGSDAASDFLGMAGGLMADAYFNSEKMWEYWPAVTITNKTGFAAIPSGYGMVGSEDEFDGDPDYAVYWSSESFTSGDDTLGVCRMINVNKPDLIRNALNSTCFLASVRCVRDSEEE